jgi:hypothetical protein
MNEFLEKLFSSDVMPHGYCYLWRPGLVPLVMQVNNNGFAGIMNIPKHTFYNTELDRHQSPATYNALNPRGV